MSEDLVTPGTRMRCTWQVFAGIVPEEPTPEFTRSWTLSGECWERENEMTQEEFLKEHPEGVSTYAQFADQAHKYALSLTDPRRVNWVRVDWIWY